MDPLENDELLTEVIRALVDQPEKVKVAERRSNGHSHLTIEVEPQDRGKVIGREGKTMNALRILFGRIGAAEGRKIFLRVHGDTRVT
jgi:uncharacterized protein